VVGAAPFVEPEQKVPLAFLLGLHHNIRFRRMNHKQVVKLDAVGKDVGYRRIRKAWDVVVERESSVLGMNAALAQIAFPIVPVAFGRRGEQLHGPSLQRDRCNQRILCVVISWKWGFQGFHRNDGGCRDGDVTGFGQGAILAEDDPAMGGKWAGSPAVLRAGRAF
jgi:hypothetical protein